jgi:hypothetical protein
MNQRIGTVSAGDLVEVKTPDEILETLQADGTLDHLPFMPEMVHFCGKRFRVSRRVARMCMSGPQVYGTMREFTTADVVLLDDLRCSGAAHGGCERECVIFWREAWLRKVSPSDPRPVIAPEASKRLSSHLRVMSDPKTYFCQASELFKVTSTLTRREQLQHCVHEVRTGDCGAFEMVSRLWTWFYWRVRRKLLGEYARGRYTATPTATLDLKPGEWVEVKSLESIMETLNPKGYNRGLYFSPDMRLACGKRYRVNRRIDNIIEDGTGKMRRLYNTVWLEGSLCACPYINIGGCTRVDIVYWREIWLNRIESPASERESSQPTSLPIHTSMST